MSKISFKDNGEDHNFWQNYTDLMSGFLIVFIITSLVAYSSYKVYVDLYHEKGITEANINAIVINAELYKKIKDFQNVQQSLNSDYFKYNNKYQRIECKVDVRFSSESPIIPRVDFEALQNAGEELEGILKKFKESTDVSFKIVIEGRAAKKHGFNPTISQRRFAELLSYERARNLFAFWNQRGILKDIEEINGEVFISGSGFGGQGRYTGYGVNGEDRNKTFIIQIIPYIKY